MKEIKDWQAIVILNGKEQIALPLPNCIIKGYLEGEIVKIQAIDIDISKLIAIDPIGEKYILSGAKDTYLNTLNRFIEISKEKDIKIPEIQIEFIKDDLER